MKKLILGLIVLLPVMGMSQKTSKLLYGKGSSEIADAALEKALKAMQDFKPSQKKQGNEWYKEIQREERAKSEIRARVAARKAAEAQSYSSSYSQQYIPSQVDSYPDQELKEKMLRILRETQPNAQMSSLDVIISVMRKSYNKGYRDALDLNSAASTYIGGNNRPQIESLQENLQKIRDRREQREREIFNSISTPRESTIRIEYPSDADTRQQVRTILEERDAYNRSHFR